MSEEKSELNLCVWNKERVCNHSNPEELNLVPFARATLSEAFTEDPSFRNSYVANIAMRVLHDQFGMSPQKANEAADKILKLIIEDKPI